MMNDVLKAIHDRRSTRGFSDVQLTEEQLNTLIGAALASPSARNLQCWHFSFVQDQKILDEISKDLFETRFAHLPVEKRGRFAEDGYHAFYHAPTVVFISIPKETDNRFVEIDAGIACENIVLAAQSMGLGSVIVGMVKDVFLTEKEAYYNKALGIPEGYEYAIAIVIGHNTVTKEAHPIDMNKVSIIR